MPTLSYVVGTFQAMANSTPDAQTADKLTIIGSGFAANQNLTCTTNINGSVSNLAVTADASGDINQVVLCPTAAASVKLPLVGSTHWTGLATSWTATTISGTDTVSVTVH